MSRAAEKRARIRADMARKFSSLEALTLSQISADPTDMVAMDDVEGRKVNFNPLVQIVRSDLERKRWLLSQSRRHARERALNAPATNEEVLSKAQGPGNGFAP